MPHRRLSSILIPLLACLCLPSAHGQKVSETVTTSFQAHAESAKGAHLRPQVNEVLALVRAKRLPEARRAAGDLQRKFEASFDPKVRQYIFQSQEEYREFKGTSSQVFEWIDWGYKECLQMQAFIASDSRDFSTALSILATVETLAPMSASAAAERGYILNQLGKPEEALAAYQRALALATRYRTQQPFHAASLRGIGFSLIELQRWDEAEKTFQDSLKIEPENKVALSELAYIREMRARK